MISNVISTAEAARRLGYTQAMIAKLWRDGVIRGYKLRPGVRNSPLRVRAEDIEAIIEERSASAAPAE